ncbi:unnamed protein product [Tuber melanosporum]|uniref:(Perigord truffle) hypothetical protein n=1 Tax=Tuber melanosporum (strain Mel28) TaxID=656061 RepID=D5GMK3_TUBMM|nr:uncharacterized protein GSTUM_00010776001 [Tuber melanosporum]CAZ85746.1 unnamed protein product [Tuber melanosporum]
MSKEEAQQNKPFVESGIPAYDNNHEAGFVQEYTPAKDGIELHPKPTADPLDPLNFPRWQKWTALGIVMWMYFLFTYITTTTVPSFALLQEQFSISYSQVNWTVALPALGLSVGPLVWSSLSDIYGRRIILIIGTIIALVATIGSAVAKTYSSYMAARFFQGLGVAPASTVGMAVVNDLFFEHERGQKLGLWVLAIDMGLLVGPLIGGFVTLVDQYWVAWLTAIFFAVLLIAQIFFFPETLYPRRLMLSQLPTSSGLRHDNEKTATVSASNDIARTKQLPFLNIWKIPGIEHPKPWDTLVRFIEMWTFPNVAVAVVVYSFAWYWWIMSVITYLPPAYPEYRPQIQGLLYGGMILGTLFSEVLCSGTLGDWIVIKLAKKNNNVRVAEMRLWLLYPATVITSVGLIVWGVSVDKHYHWMVGQVALFLVAAGIQMGNTAICAYIVDCYPLHAMSVISFYVVLLNLSAFANPFFIAPWCDTVGFTGTFTTQGLLTAVVVIPAICILHVFGKRWRERRGAPKWISPEYA